MRLDFIVFLYQHFSHTFPFFRKRPPTAAAAFASGAGSKRPEARRRPCAHRIGQGQTMNATEPSCRRPFCRGGGPSNRAMSPGGREWGRRARRILPALLAGALAAAAWWLAARALGSAFFLAKSHLPWSAFELGLLERYDAIWGAANPRLRQTAQLCKTAGRIVACAPFALFALFCLRARDGGPLPLAAPRSLFGERRLATPGQLASLGFLGPMPKPGAPLPGAAVEATDRDQAARQDLGRRGAAPEHPGFESEGADANGPSETGAASETIRPGATEASSPRNDNPTAATAADGVDAARSAATGVDLADAPLPIRGAFARIERPRPRPNQAGGRDVLLGRVGSRCARLPQDEFVYFAAPTRSGKGVSFVVPNCLNYGESMVVFDPKSEIMALTAGFRAAMGQEIYCFNPCGLGGPPGFAQTHRYNPFGYVSPDPSRAPSDIRAIAAVLYPLRQSGADGASFFQESAMRLFCALAQYAWETRFEREEPVTLALILAMFSPQGQDLQDWIGAELGRRAESGAALSQSCAQSLAAFAQANKRTASDVVATLQAPLGIFANPAIAAATAANDFSFLDLRRKKMTVYVNLRPNEIKSCSLLVNLFFSQLIDQCVAQGLPEADLRLNGQTLLLIDEFAALGRVEALERSVSFMAGYGLRLALIFQSRAQLAALYGKEGAQTFFSNFSAQIICAPNDDADAEAFSAALGYYSHKPQRDRDAKGRPMASKEQKRAYFWPHELKQLPKNVYALRLKGLPPALCKALSYHADKAFAGKVGWPAPPIPLWPAQPPMADPERLGAMSRALGAKAKEGARQPAQAIRGAAASGPRSKGGTEADVGFDKQQALDAQRRADEVFKLLEKRQADKQRSGRCSDGAGLKLGGTLSKAGETLNAGELHFAPSEAPKDAVGSLEPGKTGEPGELSELGLTALAAMTDERILTQEHRLQNGRGANPRPTAEQRRQKMHPKAGLTAAQAAIVAQGATRTLGSVDVQTAWGSPSDAPASALRPLAAATAQGARPRPSQGQTGALAQGSGPAAAPEPCASAHLPDGASSGRAPHPLEEFLGCGATPPTAPREETNAGGPGGAGLGAERKARRGAALEEIEEQDKRLLAAARKAAWKAKQKRVSGNPPSGPKPSQDAGANGAERAEGEKGKSPSVKDDESPKPNKGKGTRSNKGKNRGNKNARPRADNPAQSETPTEIQAEVETETDPAFLPANAPIRRGRKNIAAREKKARKAARPPTPAPPGAASGDSPAPDRGGAIGAKTARRPARPTQSAAKPATESPIDAAREADPPAALAKPRPAPPKRA